MLNKIFVNATFLISATVCFASAYPFLEDANEVKSFLKGDSLGQLKALMKWVTENSNPKVANIRLVSRDSQSAAVTEFLNALTITDEFTVTNGMNLTYSEIRVPSFVIIFLKNDSIVPEESIKLAKWIRNFANRRRDHFVFIGEHSEILAVWNDFTLNKLKWKWGIDTKTGSVYTSIQSAFHPLQPTIFKSVDGFISYFKPEMFGIGHNIRGRVIRQSCWIHAAPYCFLSSVSPTGEMKYDGTHFRIFNESNEYFNYTNDVQPTFDATYADHLQNGTWTGIVGNLLYEERNFDLLQHLAPQIVWFDLFDFTSSVTTLSVHFVTVKPTLEIKWEAFLYPFSWNVWLFLVLSMISISLTLSILLTTKYCGTSCHSDFSSEDYLYLAWSIPYKIALEQMVKVPSRAKALTSIWLFCVIITGSAYRTEILSALTFPEPAILPKTNAELVRSSEYNVLINALGEVEVAMFQTSESPVIQAIAKRATFIKDQYDCLTKTVLQPKTVCFSWCPMLQLVAAETLSVDLNVNPFVLSTENVVNSYLAVAFQKDSPYTDGFSPIILALYESGTYGLWDKDIYAEQRKKGYKIYKNSSSHSDVYDKMTEIINEIEAVKGMIKPLTIQHLKMMFCIEIIGLSLAAITFLLELKHKILNWFRRVWSVFLFELKARSRPGISNVTTIFVQHVGV